MKTEMTADLPHTPFFKNVMFRIMPKDEVLLKLLNLLYTLYITLSISDIS